MSASDIETASQLLASHPPVIIGVLCIFMYIRGRILHAGYKAPMHGAK